MDNFLDELEKIIPVTAAGWDRVAEIHLSRYPDQQRGVDSFKRKFKELHCKKVPIGNPLCPPAIRQAKRLKYLIIDKMDASDLNEYDSGVEEDGAGEGEDDRSGDEAASFLVRGASVKSDEDDEALGLGLDIKDNSRNEEGRRNRRGEGLSERGRLSRASVTAASEGGDVGGFSWPSSRASVTAASEGAAAEGGG